MDFKDYYKILAVDPTADEKAIKVAYRKLARKYHPDVSKEAGAEEKFKEANEAYEVLSSPEKRAEYDDLRKYGRQGQPFQAPPGWQSRAGAGGFGGADNGDFSDFFSSIFGGRPQQGGRSRNPGRKGQDVEMELAIFLEETLSGESKQVSFKVPQHNAAGQRVADVTKTLNVKIPAGVTDGERIRLKGQGAPGVAGGESGDLYLIIRLAPHPKFEVEGHDLIITVPVAPWEAALGAKVAVPTLTGKINLTVRPDSQNGQRLRIKGNGLLNKQGQRGDLLAQIKVVMPRSSDEATQELWKKLADKAAFDPRAQW
ncbi:MULTISPECIES: curved DNA-binding protein [Pseudomonas]|uniref:curved DNA-binding protein n=1 Tax=Pseudomonas TaxID=286 RepID=UPI00040837B2|nr:MULTISPECIES: curved DNA-binding protein [Pseudomonas]MCQ2998761.1 curved DNA-binding protein [Pseudomonas syringae]RMR04295.1 Curved-DNA-binding protein [Pseudomonas savastanoi pv. glycinea]MCD5989903.1 curved DNA-binding protein [Pseudomonas quasicaspiana]MCQ3030175.1 curved DNA-binding protein [Pseudomonas syringae]MDG6401945.1 curved DNA-binding protein [Pseudomonas quasicaspiana]